MADQGYQQLTNVDTQVQARQCTTGIPTLSDCIYAAVQPHPIDHPRTLSTSRLLVAAAAATAAAARGALQLRSRTAVSSSSGKSRAETTARPSPANASTVLRSTTTRKLTLVSVGSSVNGAVRSPHGTLQKRVFFGASPMFVPSLSW